MFLNQNSLGAFLTLLPCTMEDGVFVTNIKWKIRGLHHNRKRRFFLSKKVFLRDPVKKDPIEIQLRLVKEPGSHGNKYEIEYWNGYYWNWNSSVDFKNITSDLVVTVHLPNNFFYGSKTLDENLRVYLASIHGETITFGDKIRSIQRCSKETLLAFVNQEYNEDFVVECDGQEFKIKKIFLQARSPVFERMLSTNYFKEGRDNRMIINDYGSEIVKKMLEFFQTDFIKDTSNCEIELYEISRKYMSQSFMEFTRLSFVNSLTIDNYPVLFEIVQKHDDHETKKLMNKRKSEIHTRLCW